MAGLRFFSNHLMRGQGSKPRLVSRVAPRPGTFWRTLYRLSYHATAKLNIFLTYIDILNSSQSSAGRRTPRRTTSSTSNTSSNSWSSPSSRWPRCWRTRKTTRPQQPPKSNSSSSSNNNNSNNSRPKNFGSWNQVRAVFDTKDFSDARWSKNHRLTSALLTLKAVTKGC